VSETSEPVTAAVAPAADTLSGQADPLAGAVQAVSETSEPVTAAVAPAADTLSGQADPLAGAVQAVSETSEPVTAAVAPAADTLSGQADPLAGAVQAVGQPGGLPDITETASEGAGGSWLPFEALPAWTPGGDDALMLSAGLAALAGLAFVARGSGAAASLMTMRFFLPNLRLIPLHCVVGGSITRYASMATAGATTGLRGGGSVGAAVGRPLAAVDELAHLVRDGFMRGAGRPESGEPTGTGDDGASDTRLAMQIGMLLGAVYLAFLTIWFWATRLRWNPRI
jgi:hypothetical protein